MAHILEKIWTVQSYLRAVLEESVFHCCWQMQRHFVEAQEASMPGERWNIGGPPELVSPVWGGGRTGQGTAEWEGEGLGQIGPGKSEFSRGSTRQALGPFSALYTSTWTCTSTIAGTDLSRRVTVTAAYSGVRAQMVRRP